MTGNGLLAAAKNAVEDVQWIPDWGRARIDSMLEQRPDWCISRQRTWGVPIALFVHNVTGEIHPDTQALMEQVAVRMESQGIDAWFELDPAELLGEDAAHYEKVTDTVVAAHRYRHSQHGALSPGADPRFYGRWRWPQNVEIAR
jgi:isoleucyl-tRNA synthetase